MKMLKAKNLPNLFRVSVPSVEPIFILILFNHGVYGGTEEKRICSSRDRECIYVKIHTEKKGTDYISFLFQRHCFPGAKK